MPMDFSQALLDAKSGKTISREAWGDDISVRAQFPDENSANTLPYLFMVKNGGATRFPLDLSCEALFAEDWQVVD